LPSSRDRHTHPTNPDRDRHREAYPDTPPDDASWMSSMEKSVYNAKQKSKGSFFKKKIVPKEQKVYKNKAKEIKPAPGLLPAEVRRHRDVSLSTVETRPPTISARRARACVSFLRISLARRRRTTTKK
jgi:hypothetical protein